VSPRKAGQVKAVPDRAPQPGPTLAPVRRIRPPGQRLYDMPYSAVAPRMVNPDLGLHNLVARAGHNAAYEIDVTLLDAPDHRLIRSGVLLAHRVIDGRGEWYLTAPDWQPLLPKDRIELMGHADLPEELADLIRPLRRRAPLGPVAALRCDRREFALRDDAGTTVALLRDDKVTVRRGGLTTARYREVMLTPVGPGLSEDQTGWLDRALLGAGSTLVERFPRLVTRLGAPATGPSDIPAVTTLQPDSPFRVFVGQLLGLRLRQIIEADLGVRGGDPAAVDRLVDQARLLLAELRGVAVAAAPAGDWLEDLGDELAWLLAEPAAGRPADQVPSRLRSERYLALLDALVTAARGPRLAEPGTQSAVEVVGALVEAVVQRLAGAVERVPAGSPELAAWAEVREVVALVDATTALAGHVLPDRAAKLTARLAKPRRLLTRVQTSGVSAQQELTRAAGLTAEQAFAAGRAYERQDADTRRAHAAAVRAWTKACTKLAQQRPVRPGEQP